MKTTHFLALAVSAGALMTACQPDLEEDYGPYEPANGVSRPESKPESINRMQEPRFDEFDVIKDNAVEAKTKFVAQARDDLASATQELNQFTARLANANQALKDEAETKLSQLRDQAAQFEERLHAAGEATDSAWEQTRDELKQAQDDIHRSMDDLREWFNKNIGS